MSTYFEAVNASTLLRALDMEPDFVYDFTRDVLEEQRVKLDSFKRQRDAKKYVLCLKRIAHCERVLSLLRLDALDARLGVHGQSIN